MKPTISQSPAIYDLSTLTDATQATPLLVSRQRLIFPGSTKNFTGKEYNTDDLLEVLSNNQEGNSPSQEQSSTPHLPPRPP